MSNDFYVAFSGPPNTGKTTLSRTLAGFLRLKGANVIHDGFAWPIKRMVSALVGIPYGKMNTDALMDRSDESAVTSRQFLISLHDDYLAPTYGEDFLARMMIYRHSERKEPTIIMIDDLGFQFEHDLLPRKRSYVFQVVRTGCTFAGDNREFVDPVNAIYHNNHEIFAARRHMAQYAAGVLSIFKGATGVDLGKDQ